MPPDPFQLNRFVEAQAPIYTEVCAELRVGRKESHWMWFVFPKIDGLGFSGMARFYAVKSIEEASAYLQHQVLGRRLIECTEILLKHHGKSASEIFGFPDDLKLRSSMTLFAVVSEAGSIFHRVVEQFFNGEPDSRTLEWLALPQTSS